jgi:hypothetical protein
MLVEAPVIPAYQIIDRDPARVGAWMQQQAAAFYRDGAACIGLEHDGQLVAGALFDYCNGASIFGHIAITGRITREWLWFISYYPFVQCGREVVIGLVPAANLKARRFDEHFGFKLLGGVPGGDPGGDLLIYTLSRADCRFLRRPSHE